VSAGVSLHGGRRLSPVSRPLCPRPVARRGRSVSAMTVFQHPVPVRKRGGSDAAALTHAGRRRRRRRAVRPTYGKPT